jgi:HEAT repeats
MPTAEAVDAMLDLLGQPPVPTPQPELDYQPEQHPWALLLAGLAERFAPPSAERRYRGGGEPRLLATMDDERRARFQAVALHLLEHSDEAVRREAGVVVARAAHDPAALLAAIGKALAEPVASQAFHTLLAAYRSSDAPLPDPATGEAAAMVWLDRLVMTKAERPGSWKDTLTTLLNHQRPRIREWALMLLPNDDHERWRPALAAGLHDDDAQVRSRAINACWTFNDNALLPDLQAAMVRDQDPMGAARVINKVGGPCAEIAAWIEVVEHSTIRFATSNGASCLFRNINKLEVRNHLQLETEPSGAYRHAFAERLRAFLVANHDAIENGTMSMPGKDWPADLLPEGWFFMFQDNTAWPPGNHL